MRLAFEHRLVINCELCGGSVGDHQGMCPVGQMEHCQKWADGLPSWRCAACHTGYARQNDMDYIECERCSTQWVRRDGAGDQIDMLFRGDMSDYVYAVRLPEKGTGRYPHLLALERWGKEVRQALQAKKRKRKPVFGREMSVEQIVDFWNWLNEDPYAITAPEVK